jgi:hypothetical protein
MCSISSCVICSHKMTFCFSCSADHKHKVMTNTKWKKTLQQVKFFPLKHIPHPTRAHPITDSVHLRSNKKKSLREWKSFWERKSLWEWKSLWFVQMKIILRMKIENHSKNENWDPLPQYMDGPDISTLLMHDKQRACSCLFYLCSSGMHPNDIPSNGISSSETIPLYL